MSVTRASGVTERVVPFTAGDGMSLNLINVCGSGHRGPVMLAHGAGVRANLFRPTSQRNIVDVLVDDGWDVWLENWRASVDPSVTPNNWTLDDAAVYDHPAAIETIVAETGADTVKAIVHCQGATSFSMSAAAGLVPQVDTILCSAVSLLINVPSWSAFKLRFAVPMLARMTDSIDPGQADNPRGFAQKLTTAAVKLTHRECDDTACRMVSFVFGAGLPALWEHENLTDEVHHPFIQQEFGRVPMSFFQQMRECVANEQLVSKGTHAVLPARFGEHAPKTDARFVFFTGVKNKCFSPKGLERTFEWLDTLDPGRHSLHLFPQYSHLDVFFGKHAERDIFPTLLAELHKDSGR